MENLKENLEFCIEDVKKFQTSLHQKLYDSENGYTKERNKILRITTAMKLAIQTMEDKLLAENDHLFSEYEEYLNKSVETCAQIEKEVIAIQSQVADELTTDSKDDATDESLLLHKFDSLHDRIVALQKGMVQPLFTPVQAELSVVQNLKIGKFERNESNQSASAQSLGFSTHRTVDANPCFPTGFLWINKMFVISDKNNQKLKFFAEDGTFLCEILFSDASPYGVCHVQGDSFAVTLPKIKQIYLVGVQNNIAGAISNFQTYAGYTGLSKGMKEGSMIASFASNIPGQSHVDVIGFQGEIFLSFKNDPQIGLPLFEFPRYVVGNQGVLIISDWRKNCIIFLREAAGSILKEYRGTPEYPLLNPYDISLDSRGNVYVLNGKDGTIHVLDNQYNLADVIKQTTDLLSPRLISYDDASGRLAVTYAAGDVKTFHHRVPVPKVEKPESPPPYSPPLLPPTSDAHN